MSRNPQFDQHAAYIQGYIEQCGLYALTQEIRFVITSQQGLDAVLDALVEFQDKLDSIQKSRVQAAIQSGQCCKPLGVI